MANLAILGYGVSEYRKARSAPVTPADKRNEHRKLAANWANTIATAVMTAGTFIPVAQFIYGILPQGTDLALIYGSAAVCIVAGLLIHLAGHWFLGGLE